MSSNTKYRLPHNTERLLEYSHSKIVCHPVEGPIRARDINQSREIPAQHRNSSNFLLHRWVFHAQDLTAAPKIHGAWRSRGTIGNFKFELGTCTFSVRGIHDIKPLGAWITLNVREHRRGRIR